MSATILITGATGHLGSAVIDQLLNKLPANTIAALARDKEKAHGLTQKGIDVRSGDYHDTASLVRAMQGIETLLLISSSDFHDRAGQHRNAVDAAKEARVKHIFYTGVTMHNIDKSPLKPLLYDHFQTEDYIRSNGFTYTFLRNNLYADVIPMFAGEAAPENGIYFPAGEGKVAFTARKDFGEAIGNILAGTGHENKIYALTGSTAYSFHDVASILSELQGKPVSYTSPESEEFEAALKNAGLPEGIVMMSALFGAAIKQDDFNIVGTTLEAFLGRPQTDLKSFLKDTYALHQASV